MRRGYRFAQSYDVEFSHATPLSDTLIAEQSEIDRYILLMGNELRDGAAGGGRLLQAVTREAIREDEIHDLRMPPDHGILVEGVVVVVSGPGALQLECLHRGRAMRKRRPYHLVELRVVHVEIRGARVRLLRWRDPADIHLALRPDPNA